MGLYHQASFTLTPETPIPSDAAPAVGIDETGQAAELAAYSQQWVQANGTEIRVHVDVTPGYVTVTLNPEQPLVEPFQVHWNWGDGDHETGHDTLQGHPYMPGSYMLSAVVEQPGLPSLDLSVPVTV